jgi:hypothetical protein
MRGQLQNIRIIQPGKQSEHHAVARLLAQDSDCPDVDHPKLENNRAPLEKRIE